MDAISLQILQSRRLSRRERFSVTLSPSFNRALRRMSRAEAERDLNGCFTIRWICYTRSAPLRLSIEPYLYGPGAFAFSLPKERVVDAARHIKDNVSFWCHTASLI